MTSENHNQHGWQSEGTPITTPPTMMSSVMPVQPGIPMVQPGVPYGQVVIPGQLGVPIEVPPGGWPMPNSNCPPGLEYLTTLDHLLVDQQVEFLEVITGWETKNKYIVKDSRGQVIYYVAEESDCCTRMCCGKNRPFEIRIVDVTMREVIRLVRPLRSSSCFCPCWLQKIEVFSNGIKMGSVVQNWSPIFPSFTVCDAIGNSVLTIEGSCCMSVCFGMNFDVLSSDGQHKVGKISKKWSGLIREIFTDADIYGINFPADLDVKIKAVLLGACFLIDFMYFEESS